MKTKRFSDSPLPRRLIASACLWLALCAMPVSAASLALVATQDASIYNFSVPEFPDAQLADGQGDLWVGVTAGALDRRLLLRFDLSSVPTGHRITSAKLRLYVTRSLKSGNDPTHLHRLTRAWSEGPSNGGGGGGTTAVVGDVTWQRAHYNTVAWTQPGGDFNPVAGASQIVGAVVSPVLIEYTSAALAADAQQWLDNPAANFGWILIAAPSPSDAVTAKRFASRDEGVASQRPTLLIETEPVPADSGDVPLPLWSLAILALALLPALRRGMPR